jgi:hypothetical protein
MFYVEHEAWPEHSAYMFHVEHARDLPMHGSKCMLAQQTSKVENDDAGLRVERNPLTGIVNLNALSALRGYPESNLSPSGGRGLG